MAKCVLFLCITTLSFFCITFAFQSPLQDFCVADPTASATGSGLACKPPASVKADDFFFSGLHLPSNTTNIYGAGIVPVSVNQMPGLNYLGISIARVDLALGGLFPPHIHPRGTEIVTVLEGSLQVGFVTSNPTYSHFTKTLNKGDVFAVPPGLVHYAYNVGKGNTVAIVSWNSPDLGGVSLLPRSIFGPTPDLDSGFLAKAFQVDKTVVEAIQAKFN